MYWFAAALVLIVSSAFADDCRIKPIIYKIEYPGCDARLIPSFACSGRCTSYVQVSASKIWQMERSCMCCQESGEREAVVSLTCRSSSDGQVYVMKVPTRAPFECMCRPCTAIDEASVMPQELAAVVARGQTPPFQYP